MALWSIYVELNGYPLDVEVELDDEYETSEDVVGYVYDNLIVEVTKEA
jgi:hypothetical protein